MFFCDKRGERSLCNKLWLKDSLFRFLSLPLLVMEFLCSMPIAQRPWDIFGKLRTYRFEQNAFFSLLYAVTHASGWDANEGNLMSLRIYRERNEGKF
jgi:hypothetical protein